MILSNIEIQKALDEGRLIIKPEPTPRSPEIGKNCPYDTHSVDLTLSTEISVPEGGSYCIDFTTPGKIADCISRHSKKRTIDLDQPYRLKQNHFILGLTRESISLPINPQYDTCLAARIEGKSSRARCGLLIHFTAPTVHPGWNGPLALEMINLGPAPINLLPGMAIAQLIIEEVKGIPFGNPSQFHGQSKPEGLL